MSRTGLPAVVIDNGTGYTKMGFAGNVDPQYIIPSIIATPVEKSSVGTGQSQRSRTAPRGIEDLDFFIGFVH